MINKLPLILGLLVVGTVGAFLYFKKPALGPAVNAPTTFAELMAMGENYTCTFTDTDETGAVNQGTVFIASQGQQFRGNFMTTSVGGEEMQSHMIRTGDTNYIWSADEMQGMMMKLDPEDDQLFPETGDDDTEQVSFDENEPMEFDCQPWRVDSSFFTPPSDVEFVDFSAQMELMMEQMQEVPTSEELDCSLCDQVPAGEARTACLTSLGC